MSSQTLASINVARQTIKAVLQPDPASTQLILTTLPYPTPSATEYVVRVKAAAATKDELGWELADPHFFSAPRDRVPCIEGSGVVVSAPPNAPCPPGADVFFITETGRTGALRQFATVDIGAAAAKPAALDWVQAAATPLSALTAYQGLFEHGPLDPAALRHDSAARAKNAQVRVLVSGAGGGVGSWAVKLASRAGATVIGVARAAKAGDVRAFGAADVLDYDGVPAWSSKHENRVDLVLDTIGGEEGMRALWSAVKDGGAFLAVGPDQPDTTKPAGKNARSEWFLVHSSGEQLAAIARLIDDDGGLRPLVDAAFPFEQFREAFERVYSGKTKGKVVITVDLVVDGL